jgi:hypothetical protein
VSGIVVSLIPRKAGRQTIRFGLVDGDSISLTQFVYP